MKIKYLKKEGRYQLPEATEHQVQTLLINYLRSVGWFVMRLNSGAVKVTNKYNKQHMMRLSAAGTPDLFALKKGRPIFIEVKRNKKMKPTAYQLEKMAEIERHGATCLIATSIEDCKEFGL